MKLCKKCGIDKPLNLLKKDKTYADGRRPICLDCFRFEQRERYYRNRDLDYYREKRKRTVRKHDLKRHYGITDDVVKGLSESQRGRCAICDSVLSKPHIDHDHISGNVRGLLCQHCNFGLGHFKDNPYRLKSAIEYLGKIR